MYIYVHICLREQIYITLHHTNWQVFENKTGSQLVPGKDSNLMVAKERTGAPLSSSLISPFLLSLFTTDKRILQSIK